VPRSLFNSITNKPVDWILLSLKSRFSTILVTRLMWITKRMITRYLTLLLFYFSTICWSSQVVDCDLACWLKKINVQIPNQSININKVCENRCILVFQFLSSRLLLAISMSPIWLVQILELDLFPLVFSLILD
jgi:hypothetical protein